MTSQAPQGTGLAALLWQLSQHQIRCRGLLSVDRDSQGRATSSLSREHQMGAPGGSSQSSSLRAEMAPLGWHWLNW